MITSFKRLELKPDERNKYQKHNLAGRFQTMVTSFNTLELVLNLQIPGIDNIPSLNFAVKHEDLALYLQPGGSPVGFTKCSVYEAPWTKRKAQVIYENNKTYF